MAPGDTDTAVFWDVRANYTIATSTDGSILVSHTGFDPTNLPVGVTTRISDGVDKLRNIEKLQFADVTVNLSPPELKLRAFDPGGVVADDFANAGYANNSATNCGLEAGSKPAMMAVQQMLQGNQDHQRRSSDRSR